MEHGLTLFIPLYNEEAILRGNVSKLTNYVDHLALPYEVVLGSNGSTDRTPHIGHELDSEHCHIIFFHLPRRGPGLAFAEALRRARYSFFLCLDVDLSNDLEFIQAALEALEHCDAVVGSKLLGTQKRPMWRKAASDIFIACTRHLLHMPYHDYSIGAKAYRTESIRPFLRRIDRHTFYTQELLYQLRKTGKRIIEIPVNCSDRRKSKFNLVHEGFYRYMKLFELWVRSLQD